MTSYTNIAWPIFAKALLDFDDNERFFLVKLLTDGGTPFENNGSPLWALPISELKSWAKKNPDIVPLILHFMSLYLLRKSDDGGEEFVWHPHALSLMEIGDVDEVIGCIHANLASFGSSGSRVPYLQKRIDLLKRLPTNNERFRRVADALIPSFKEMLEMAKKHEEQMAAGIF